MKTYYEILGVPKDADKPALKSAYRKLVKQFHPDVNPRGEKIFEEISRAYSVLNSPEKRREYDRKLQSGQKSQAGSMLKFKFREFREWLFSIGFIRSLFIRKRVAATPKEGPKIDPAIVALDSNELLKRVIYSNNVHVQVTAVRAILAKDRLALLSDLIRILYSNVGEEVKSEIVQGIADISVPSVRKALGEVYELERSLRVKKLIRSAIQTA